MQEILSTRLGQMAYADKYNMPLETVQEDIGNQYNMISAIKKSHNSFLNEGSNVVKRHDKCPDESK